MRMSYFEGPSSAERRREPRRDADLPLELYSPEDHLLDEDPQLKNCSSGGIGFLSVQRFATGEAVRFRLGLSAGVVLSGEARILWNQVSSLGPLYMCGAEIVSMPHGDRKKLRRYLDPRAPNWTYLLDVFLVASTFAVLCLITKDIRLTPRAFNLPDEAGSYLAMAIIAGACILGILMAFRQ